MNNQIRTLISHCLVFFSVLLVVMPVVAGEREITANGFFANKVIFMIEGQPLVINVGDTRQGIRLLESTGTQAIVEINGIRKVLKLDEATPNEYASFASHDKSSHIISIRLVQQTDNIATFEVDYFYAGEKGEIVTLSAETFLKKSLTRYSAHSYTKIKKGRHTASITIAMNDKAPKFYMSDAVLFTINGTATGKGNSGLIDKKSTEFIKSWKREVSISYVSP